MLVVCSNESQFRTVVIITELLPRLENYISWYIQEREIEGMLC